MLRYNSNNWGGVCFVNLRTSRLEYKINSIENVLFPRHGENLGKSTLGSSFHVFLGEVFMLC